MVRQFDYHYVILDDHLEAASAVLKALCDKGISLLAFSSFPNGDGKTQLDLVPEDSEALAYLLKGMGLRVSARKSGFLVRTDKGPCAIAAVLDKLDRARVPVVSVQSVSTGASRCGALLWVKPGDVRKAAGVLGAPEMEHDLVDEASEESFLASDPPAWTVGR